MIVIVTVILTGRERERGWRNEEEPYPITTNSSPTLLSLWKTHRSQFGPTELVKHLVVQSIAQGDQRKSFA